MRHAIAHGVLLEAARFRSVCMRCSMDNPTPKVELGTVAAMSKGSADNCAASLAAVVASPESRVVNASRLTWEANTAPPAAAT